MKRYSKKTCLLFGEGRKELIFFRFLENSKKFKDKFPNWRITQDHAHGESCRTILNKCINSINQLNYDLVLCFIDEDKLYIDFPKTNQKEKDSLETLATKHGVEIVWQNKNHEEEMGRASNGRIKGKGRMLARLLQYESKIMNSPFTKKILNYFDSK